MSAVITALTKAFGQIADKAVIRVVLKSVLVTLVIFALLGTGLYAGLEYALGAAGWSDGGYGSAVAAVLIAGVSAWFLFRVVALAVLQFFADEIVAAVEAKHYPARAELVCKLPFREELAHSLRGIGRTIGANLLALPVALILLFTGIGAAAVFLLVNAWLLGRELTDMAWLRHCGGAVDENPVPRFERILLGGAIAAIMLIPLANLIAPILGAAAGTHLAHRAIEQRAIEKRELGADA